MSDRRAGPVAQCLIDGAKYLAEPGHWCRHHLRQRTGMLWWKTEAYCAHGYIQHRIPGGHQSKAIDYLGRAVDSLWPDSAIWPILVNDHYGQDATVKMFKRAAELAMADGV